MKEQYILYNPEAGNGRGCMASDTLDVLYINAVKLDITKINSYDEFFRSLDPSDEVTICGGDGTLNRFANDTKDLRFANSLYYLPAGDGNDFARDLGVSGDDFPNFRMNDYLRDLPVVHLDGENSVFLNNVGSGIDGYCCEERERQKGNHILLAIKGFLRSFSPRRAVVTVDGITQTFENVWFASTMNGRYHGGGMMAAPDQDRLDPDRTLTLVVLHGTGKLKMLEIFLSLFSGRHVRGKRHVTRLTGHRISVEFDRPTPLQFDGEVRRNVRKYGAISAKQRIFEGKL